ncbi:MAG: AI-2E family transporter [Myxococcota bacterium]
MATPWSKSVRDRWFLGFLAVSTLGVVVLFWPFVYVLLFAATTVVVTWPVYERVLMRCKGRRGLAAGVTMGLLATVVFGPLGVLMWLFVGEATGVVELVARFVNDGQLERTVDALRDEYLPSFVEQYGAYLPEDFDLVGAVLAPLQQALLQLLNSAGGALPGLLNRLVSTGVDAVIFLFAVVSLYMEGPRVLTVLKNLTPIEDSYLEHLFRVFREFANNMVVGSLVTAALQGVVAAAGYWAVGVDRVVFLGICTAVFSFVPMVGTLVVWLPVCIYVGVGSGWSWAAGLAVWNLAVTGSVDNVVKPLFLRGSSHIHPLLIFLAVFGGLSWMSVPGVLVGPVIVAFFLALYTIYCQDFLGQETGLTRKAPPALIERLLAWVDPAPAPPGEP